MISGDKSLSGSGQLSVDILVVGGGVMGLWGAVKAADAGLSVILVDARQMGAGASGGLLGALFPWMPDRWDAKKQFQYDALLTLPDEIARLENDTGLKANFRRSGRIIPLPKPHLRDISLRLERDALKSWHQGDHRFFWHVRDGAPDGGHIDDSACAAGYVLDTLAARIEPRALVSLLKAWLLRQPNVRIIEHASLVELDAAKGTATVTASAPHPSSLPAGGESGLVHYVPQQGSSTQTSTRRDRAPDPSLHICGEKGLKDGSRLVPRPRRPDEGQRDVDITFSHALIAAGVESFPILEALLPPLPKPLGQGVKGQAALLRADLDPASPVIFLDGVYIVPHEGGLAAVGSTSENSYGDPFSTDHQLETVLEKARALVPALRDAEVIERWAGIRPKAIGRDPLIGPLPRHPNIIALTGGFKISFGMAHRLAASAIDYALGHEPEGLPENFTLKGQIKAIER